MTPTHCTYILQQVFSFLFDVVVPGRHVVLRLLTQRYHRHVIVGDTNTIRKQVFKLYEPHTTNAFTVLTSNTHSTVYPYQTALLEQYSNLILFFLLLLATDYEIY